MPQDAFRLRKSLRLAAESDARRVLYRSHEAKVSSRRPIASIVPILGVAAIAASILLMGGAGCSPRDPERDPRPPVVPLVDESYAIDEVNRPLQPAEIEEAFARLESDEAAFVADLQQAPPVRQASLIFVLQQNPSVAGEHRDLLEKLSASEHGIVRRAALFALEAADEGK